MNLQTLVDRSKKSGLFILTGSQQFGLLSKISQSLAGRTGQLLNLSSLASDCGITHNTALSWISVLEAGYIVFLLRPHHKNFGKRLVKSPKIYFYDSGLAAWLLNVQGPDHLAIHPQRGSLFESLIISELLKDRFNRGLTSNLNFWRNNLGDEIDVVIDLGTRLVPVEIKSGETLNPDYFKGLKKWKKIASEMEGPSYLVYGGGEHLVSEGISVIPWNRAAELVDTKAR